MLTIALVAWAFSTAMAGADGAVALAAANLYVVFNANGGP